MTKKEIEINGMIVRSKPHATATGGETITISDHDKNLHITYVDHEFADAVDLQYFPNAKIKIIIEYDETKPFKVGH